MKLQVLVHGAIAVSRGADKAQVRQRLFKTMCERGGVPLYTEKSFFFLFFSFSVHMPLPILQSQCGNGEKRIAYR